MPIEPIFENASKAALKVVKSYLEITIRKSKSVTLLISFIVIMKSSSLFCFTILYQLFSMFRIKQEVCSCLDEFYVCYQYRIRSFDVTKLRISRFKNLFKRSQKNIGQNWWVERFFVDENTEFYDIIDVRIIPQIFSIVRIYILPLLSTFDFDAILHL
jgi:hypothetical protein